MRGRPARQPVVEVTEHDHQRVPHGIEIRQKLPYLKSPFADAKPEMRRQDMHRYAVDVDRGGERSARLATVHRQVDAVHVHDRMPSQQGVPEAPCRNLSRRAERALITVQCDKLHGHSAFDGHAGRIRELLQGDHVRIQLADDRCDPIGIVATIGADARVNVVRGDSQCCGSVASSAKLRILRDVVARRR